MTSSSIMLLILPLPGLPLGTPASHSLLGAPGPLCPGNDIGAPALAALQEPAATATLLVPSALRRRQLVVDVLGMSTGSCLAFFPELGGLHPPQGLGLYTGIALVGTPLSRFRCFSASLTVFNPLPVSLLHDASLLQAFAMGNPAPRLVWLSAAGKVLATVEGNFITAVHSRKPLLPARRAPPIKP